jgi:hypothetical protein
LVNTTDELGTRNNPASLFANIPLTNLFDFNRDGAVNISDGLLARNHATSLGTALRYIELGEVAGGTLAGLGATSSADSGTAEVGMALSLAPTKIGTASLPISQRIAPVVMSLLPGQTPTAAAVVNQLWQAVGQLSGDELADWLLDLDGNAEADA